MIARILMIAAAALAVAAPARAQQLKAKDVVRVDDGKAYVLYRTRQKFVMRFLRSPDAAEAEQWRSERADALAKAREKYARAKARYDKEYASYLEYRKVGQGYPRPARPVEPTERNFAHTPFEMANFFETYAGRVVVNEKGGYAYLLALKPGTYVFYGSVSFGGNGYLGTCMCMGSLKFEAVAGQVTDLGEIRMPALEALLDKRDFATYEAGGLTVATGLTSLMAVPATDAMRLPPQVAGKPVRPAEYRAAEKLPNYWGVLIDRITPLPGVLAYERDKLIDLRAGQGDEGGGR